MRVNFRYATIYTMFPVFSLVLDKDVSSRIALTYPELYKDLSKGRSLSFKTFFIWVLISVFQGELFRQKMAKSWRGYFTIDIDFYRWRNNVRRVVTIRIRIYSYRSDQFHSFDSYRINYGRVDGTNVALFDRIGGIFQLWGVYSVVDYIQELFR